MGAVPAGVIGLRVPGAIAYRHVAIRVVTTACKMVVDGGGEGQPGHEADGDFEAEVVSAFGEAFNNIAVHGFQGRETGTIQIEVDWDDERLTITIVDDGCTFDPDTVALPDLDQLPEHGMGLFIIRSCMDEVDYRPGPPNVLRLVKLRSRGARVPPPPQSGFGGRDGEPGRGSPNPSGLAAELAAEEEDAEGRGSGVDLMGGSRMDQDRKAESSRRR